MVTYPHTITVTRLAIDEDDMYATPTIETIWSGECINQSGRSGEVSEVATSDYVVYIPPNDIEFRRGDKTSVLIKLGRSPILGEVQQVEESELGITLWIEYNGN